MSASAENKKLIVTGDFNCDFLVKSCSKETKELKEIFRNFGLTQLIDKATRTAKESPTLLDLFAFNSPGNITFTNVVADDTGIYLSSTSILDIELKLNLDLADLSQWLHYNALVLNMKKTEFITFGTHQRPARQKCDETDISLNGQPIKYTDTFKYLGVVLDDTLSFKDHVDYVRTKVSKILGMFSRIRPSLTPEAANRLYKAMVLPVLDYCDAVWRECGQGNSDKIERLQRRAARIVYFKAASKLSTDQIMTKLGLEPLYYERRTHILRFFNEYIASSVSRYLFHYFDVRFTATKLEIIMTLF